MWVFFQMCKRYPGFLRVALQDPQPERRFFRRGWVTFDRTVNIKDICWNLNNIRVCVGFSGIFLSELLLFGFVELYLFIRSFFLSFSLSNLF